MGGLVAQRFIPAINALGSHWVEGEDPELRNEENKCYCMDDQGFPCFKSGVMNMGPCKTSESLPKGAPIALSYPHFYQADQSFRDAVMGMKPEKEKHQMFADIHPKFGFPLAFRPKFQLNAILRRDTNIPMISQFPEQLVLSLPVGSRWVWGAQRRDGGGDQVWRICSREASPSRRCRSVGDWWRNGTCCPELGDMEEKAGSLLDIGAANCPKRASPNLVET